MNEREISALAALDDRARRAADSLRAAVAASAAGDRGVPKTAASGLSGDGVIPMLGDGERGAHEDPDRVDRLLSGDDEVVVEEVVVHDTGEPGEEAGERITLGGRRTWLAAAAVLVVAAVGVVVVASREGDQPAASTDPDLGSREYLVPGWLPDGWEPSFFAGPDDAEDDDDLGLPDGEVVAYGDASLDDPWTGPVLTAVSYEADPDDVWANDKAEEITMLGVPAILWEDGDIVTAVGTVPVDGEHQEVTGYGLGRDAVREAAEHLTPALEIGTGSLPDGYEEIARGPTSTMVPFVAASFDGLAIGYDAPPGDEASGSPTGADGGARSLLLLAQQPAASAEAAAAIRLMVLDPDLGYEDEVTEVRGQPAYILRGPGGYWTVAGEEEDPADGTGSADRREPEWRDFERRENDLVMTHVQWFEPSLGLVVTVSTAAADEETIDLVVENLKVADQDELEALLE